MLNAATLKRLSIGKTPDVSLVAETKTKSEPAPYRCSRARARALAAGIGGAGRPLRALDLADGVDSHGPSRHGAASVRTHNDGHGVRRRDLRRGGRARERTGHYGAHG